MKHAIRIALITLLVSYFLPVCSIKAEMIDRIVAVVNDEPITQSELDVLLVPIYEQYRTAYKGQEFITKMNEARTNLLSQLIEDRLVAQEAKRLGIEATEEEIDAYVDEVKRKFPTEEAFFLFMEQQDMSMDKLRQRYAEQIAIRKLHQYEVRQKVVVSPLDIEAYYQDHLPEMTEKEKVKVRTIMIKKKKGAGALGVDDGRGTMERIVQELDSGTSFAELAKHHSEGMQAAEGGDLGFVKRGEMIATFDEVLFDLSVGERSPILETELGYHIFLVEARQEKKEPPLSEVKNEIHNILFRTKSKERFEAWLQELKEKAYISIK